MREFFTHGISRYEEDGEFPCFPEEEILAETAYGAIRAYKKMYPDSGWIAANDLMGDRQEWIAANDLMGDRQEWTCQDW